MSFEEAYNNYLLYASKRHKKQCFDTYTQNFRKHVLPYFKAISIQDLSMNDVVFWQDKIMEHNFSNNFNKNLYICFNSFLDYCVLCSYIPTNYLRVLGSFRKKFEPKEYNLYNYFDYKKFRKGLKNRIYRYFYDFLFFYGTRSGEAMALKFKDLHGKKIHIGASMNRRDQREIDSPKTPNSDRYLVLGPCMRFKMLILKCFYTKVYGVECSDYFIFGGKKPLSPTSIKRYKHNACISSGIKEIKVHEFRHSYATRMINLGVPIHIVSKKLGHSSVSITLDIYFHNKKREIFSLFPRFDFFDTYTQNFKKIISSIITHFV